MDWKRCIISQNLTSYLKPITLLMGFFLKQMSVKFEQISSGLFKLVPVGMPPQISLYCEISLYMTNIDFVIPAQVGIHLCMGYKFCQE